MCAFGEIAVCS